MQLFTKLKNLVLMAILILPLQSCLKSTKYDRYASSYASVIENFPAGKSFKLDDDITLYPNKALSNENLLLEGDRVLVGMVNAEIIPNSNNKEWTAGIYQIWKVNRSMIDTYGANEQNIIDNSDPIQFLVIGETRCELNDRYLNLAYAAFSTKDTSLDPLQLLIDEGSLDQETLVFYAVQQKLDSDNKPKQPTLALTSFEVTDLVKDPLSKAKKLIIKYKNEKKEIAQVNFVRYAANNFYWTVENFSTSPYNKD